MSSLQKYVKDNTGKVDINGDAIAQFQFLMRNWSREVFQLQGKTDLETRKNLNIWLTDFETMFARSMNRINNQSGFGGYSIAQYEGAKAGFTEYKATQAYSEFYEAYKNTMDGILTVDLTQARMLRNNLAVKFGDDYKLFYAEYDKYIKSAKALGLTQYEIADNFLATNIGRDFVFMLDSSGRKWQPSSYARMYARTRGREIEDIIMQKEINELGMDIVQISEANTTTPICLHYEGKYFSLNGNTPGLPVLDIHPPFHPNCVHRMRPIADADIKNMRAKNIQVDRNVKKESQTWSDSQKKQVAKQTQWNRENRQTSARAVANTLG